MDFIDEWSAVEDGVRRFCMRSARDPYRADEILQETRIRAWRGFNSFQRRASFLTWVLTIARRELAREMGRTQRYVPLESVPEPEAAAPGAEPKGEGLIPAVDDAIARGELTDAEGQVVKLRLNHPDAGWAEIGAAVSATAGHCAVLHFRAAVKLRVVLFRFHAALLGGAAEIRQAFAEAQTAAPARRLTDTEAQAFQGCILEGATPKRGDVEDLRSACIKVAQHLELF